MLHSLKLPAVIAGVAAIAAVAAIAGSAGAAPKAPNSAAPQRAHAASIANLPSAVVAAPVPQAVHDGGCNEGDACLWYGNFTGSIYNNPHNEPNLLNNRFISAGPGQLSRVGNNAEAVFNGDGKMTLVLCTGQFYLGDCVKVAPYGAATFTSTFSNNVESFYWLDSTN